MKSNLTLKALLTCWLFVICGIASTQDAGFKNQRAQEDYSYLKDSIGLKGLGAIKYISLNNRRTSYFSLGGSLRPRFETYLNQFWVPDNNLYYYSQRTGLHADLHFGKHFRLFGELQSGFASEGNLIAQTDNLDLHQGFVECKSSSSNLSLRIGRQEMQYGVGRLYDLGVGPNNRRSFDLIKGTWTEENYKLDLFYGKQVRVNFGVFDNKSNFFDSESTNSKVWGIYSQFKIFPSNENEFNTELYYLGIESAQGTYNDVTGPETRHTFGIRKFGTAWNGFSHNHELIYQVGSIADNSISAFNIEANWMFQFFNTKWKPKVGLKMDLASGDKATGDGKINSFYPLFVNPGFYNLAVVNTPVNLISVHPSITVFPIKSLIIQIEYAFFYRANSNDGIYSPPNRLTQMALGLTEKHIGNTIGLLLINQINKHFTFSIRSSYYVAGKFVKGMGLANNLFQCSPTLEYKF